MKARLPAAAADERYKTKTTVESQWHIQHFLKSNFGNLICSLNTHQLHSVKVFYFSFTVTAVIIIFKEYST